MAGILSQFRLRTLSGGVRAPSASPTGDTTHTTSLSTLSSGNTSSVGVRRPREDDVEAEDEDDDDDDNPSSGWDDLPRKSTVKRRKIFVQEVAKRLKVPTRNLDSFSELSMANMVITLMATLQRLEATKEKEALLEEVKSPTFLNLYRTRLAALLMSPGITAYVTDLTYRVLELVRRHPELFNFTEEMIRRPEIYSYIANPTSGFLTVIRGSMKQKLLASIIGKEFIGVLARKLCKYAGIDPVVEMHARLAFMRKAVLTFQTVEKRTVLGGSQDVCSPPPSTQVPRKQTDDEEEDAVNDESGVETERDEDAVRRPATGIPLDSEASGTQPLLYGPNDFWYYVDDLLNEMRAEATEKFGGDLDAVADHLEKEFNKILQEDLATFKVGAKGTAKSSTDQSDVGEPDAGESSTGIFTKWQAEMNKNMSQI